MTLRRLALTVAVLMLAAACDRGAKAPPAPPAPPVPPAAPAPPVPPTPPALEGFSHETALDLQGYYIPQPGTEPKAGALKLMNLTLGTPSDFSQWEAGKRMATYGPVLIEFEDGNTPLVKNELGGENRQSVRILPDAYRFDGKGVSFKGHHPTLGDITFVGTFDRKALDDVRQVGYGEGVVLRGRLTIGSQAFDNLAFTYFGGD